MRYTFASHRGLLLLGFLAVLGYSSLAQGQIQLISPADPDADEIHVYRLTVSPAAEPRPALKYHFLTPAVDQVHENAAMYAYKSMVYEGPDLIGEINKLNNGSDDLDNWLEMPLAEMPQQEILGRVRWISEQTNWAPLVESSKCDRCDWGDFVRRDGAHTWLPQVQKMRPMAYGLALKTRLQMAQGKYDEAIESLRVGYSLSRNLSHSESVIHSLIGMVIQSYMDTQTRTLIATENSPNLYWALTELATQPIDLRPALTYELHFWEYTIHELDGLDRGPMTNEAAAELADRVWTESRKLRVHLDRVINPITSKAEMLVWATELLPESREFLLGHDYPAAKLDAMPPLQIVLLYRWKQYLELRDDNFKWVLLPDAEARTALSSGEDRFNAQVNRGIGVPFTTGLFPIKPAFLALLRSERRIALMRAIEALRMYAAEHGRWPERLADTPVPVPIDSLTGKSFEYSPGAKVAMLSTPVEESPSPNSGACRIELVLRSKP